MTKEETTQLIVDIYKIFHDKESNMFDAYLATLSITASIAATHGVTEEEFLRDCKDSFADGQKIDSITIN